MTNKGITLIALVITIIILLILAGISIATLGRNNGLFSRAKEAKNNTLDAQNAENTAIASYNTAIDETIDGKNPGGTGSTPTTYTVGQEVTVRGESFYVIKVSDATDIVTLLAKYNLNKDGTAQAPNVNYEDTGCAFSTSNYWSSAITTSSVFDLNDLKDSDGNVMEPEGSAIAKAKSYAKLKGGISGRLLTYQEADLLKGTYENIIWGNENTQSDVSSYLNYWLGSASNAHGVWRVDGNDKRFYNYGNVGDYHYGVRPVITISK